MEKLGNLKLNGKPIIRKGANGFIKQVKDAATAEEARYLITNESALIRSDFNQSKIESLRDDLVKLIFIHLMGYPSYFGQMPALQLISSHSIEDKRVGYLCLMLFLGNNSELLLLTVNSIKNDVVNSNPLFCLLCIIVDTLHR